MTQAPLLAVTVRLLSTHLLNVVGIGYRLVASAVGARGGTGGMGAVGGGGGGCGGKPV